MKKIISMLLTIMMLFVCCNINIYATVEYKSYSGTETIQTRKYADEDYVFAVGSHKFTLLDAFDDSDSSYLIIANESYGSRTYKVDSFTSTATDSMNYWLNNTFDGLDVNIRQHIDFNHSWMIDPAPNATTPILQGTTFTAGITVPSVSELEEYGDKLGYADLGSHFGTRTVRNSTDTKNILVYQYETSDVNDTSWSLYCRSKPNIPIRPIFFVDEEFFADVKIDLTISGTTVKQEIAKLGIDTLKELYTEDEMITYLGFDESDFGGTNDNEPEDDNQETDNLYFTEKRTVNYDTPWDVNTFKTVTSQTADVDYVFTVKNGDSNESFTLLDVDANGTASKYFVIANQAYGKAAIFNTNSDVANYWKNPTTEEKAALGNNTDDIAKKYATYWLDNQHFEKGWLLNEAAYKFGASPLVPYIDNAHVWTCEPAPAAAVPNEKYTFTAGIALPSASELDTYIDRLGIADVASFGTRTMINYKDGDNTYRYMGVASTTSTTNWYPAHWELPQQGTVRIRPVCWLNNEFFANVKVDLATAGAAVKQEIAKLSVDDLKELYTEEEMITYLGFNESDFGGTEDNNPEDDNPEADGLYFAEKRTVNHDTPWSPNTFKTITSQTADVDYVFTVKNGDNNESFTLLDVDANGTASKYFVIANQAYGKAAIFNTNSDVANYWKNPTTEEKAALGNNTDDIAKKYATYWLDNQHFEKGWLLNEAAYKFGASPLVPYIDNAHVWTCEPAPAAAVPNEKYTFTAGIALPSASELDTYIDRLGIADVASFGTRTMINYKDGDNTYRYMGVASTTSTTNWYPNHWKLPQQGTVRIRPVCWLNSEFFANVKIDLATAGAAVKQEIAKLGIDALSELYTEEEMITYLGFNESDFGGTEDNNPEDDNPEADGLYFAEKRTVNHDTPWSPNTFKTITSQTADVDYVFTVKNGDNNESFTLLDVDANGTASKYFVIANQAYGKAAIFNTNSDVANYWKNPTTEEKAALGNNTDDIAKKYATYWLDNQHFEKGWLLNEAAYKFGASPLVPYIDNAHVWTCEPAPAAAVPNEKYTFTAGIALPSASELDTYIDRLGIADVASFGTRTMINYKDGDNTYRYMGVASTTSTTNWYPAHWELPQQGTVRIRPVCWLNNEFFANVKVDLATAGAAVKQEIAKLSVDDLKELYTEEEMITYLGFDESDFGSTEDNNPEDDNPEDDNPEDNNPESDGLYFAEERTVNYTAWDHYMNINASATAEEAAKYKFSLASNGDTFSLLDVKDNSASKYFVITDAPYMKKTFVKNTNPNYFATEDGTVSYTNNDVRAQQYPSWALNGQYFEKGWTFDNYNGAKKTLDTTVRSYIDFTHIWTCEPAPNNSTPNEQYTTTAGIMYPSVSEVKTYGDRFLLSTDASFATRTMANYGSETTTRYIGRVTPNDGKFNAVATQAQENVRPCFWLNDQFFSNVKIDLATAGAAVKQEIAKLGIDALKELYTEEEMITYLDLDGNDYILKDVEVHGLNGGSVTMSGKIKSNIDDETEAVIIVAIYDGEDTMVASKATDVTLSGKGHTQNVALSIGTLPEGEYAAKIMFWDNFFDANAMISHREVVVQRNE